MRHLIRVPRVPEPTSPYGRLIQAFQAAGATEFCSYCHAWVTPEHGHETYEEIAERLEAASPPQKSLGLELPPIDAAAFCHGDDGP